MQYIIQWDYKLKTEVETRGSLCSLASPSSLVNDLWPGSNHLRSGCYLGINPEFVLGPPQAQAYK